jgi:hypothetical protein
VEAESLSRFRVQSVLFELPTSPAATMSDERGAVRSICDSRPKFFRGCQYTRSSYLQEGAVHNGGHREGGKVLPLFSASSQGQRSRQRVPSRILPQKKVACERDVQAHQARSSPGCDAEGGASHVDDIARCGRWRMATADGVDAKLVRPSIQVDAGLMGSVGAVPHPAPVAYGATTVLTAPK